MKGRKLKSPLMKKYGWANKGDALIFSIGIVLLLFIITVGFLIIFSHWEKSSFLMFSRIQSDHAAKIGIEQAIWELKNDQNNYDGYDEDWHQKFIGNDIDMDGDGTNESKFFYVKNLRGKIIGRYAVLVQDESSSININCIGNLAKNGKHGFNEGWTTFEIAFFPEFCDSVAGNIVEFRRGKNLKPGKVTVDDDNDNNILSDDGIDNNGDGIIDENDEGVDEEDEFNHKKPYDDDRPFFVIEDIKMVYGITEKLFEKIKNYITCHSYDLNIDAENYLRTNINKVTASRIASILTSIGYDKNTAIQIAINTVDYRDKDDTPTVVTTPDGKPYVGIEKTPYINEIEPAPEIKIQTIVTSAGPVTIIEEKGPHFIEIFNPYDEIIDIGGWTIKGGMIILPSVSLSDHNRQTQDVMDEIDKGSEVDQSKLKNFWTSLTINSIKIPDGTKIKPRSYYLIGDSIKWKIIIRMTSAGPVILPFLIPIKEPAYADQFEPILFMNFQSEVLSNLFSIILKVFGINFLLNGEMTLLNEKNQLIEHTDYGFDIPGKMTKQKNDPRVNEWFISPQTPGKINICFMPHVGDEFNLLQLNQWPASFTIKNNPFSNSAELSFIHTGKQWKTLNMWKGYDKKLLDIFTVVEEVEKPVFGRININTATPLVLQCLPLVDTDIAREIINERPFTEFSDIVGRLHGPLNKEITKFGRNLIDDNKNTWIDTEDEKELVISKICNLITVRSNVFRITVISEKVLDSDNNGIINQGEVKAKTRYRIIYDRNNNKILERRKL
ncbi:MAG: hypothetical protein N2115_05700 [bacterium]|nr:hypothetical protein [bacterium]